MFGAFTTLSLAVLALPSSPPSPPPPTHIPPEAFPGVRLCNSLYHENATRWAGCRITDNSATDLCDVTDLHYCSCIVLEPLVNETAEAIAHRLHHRIRPQAYVQFVLSLISVIALCSYLACYGLLPAHMWRYPLNLAFWIYVCDLLVAIQFMIVASNAISYVDHYQPDELFPIGTNPDCLCDFSPYHPACSCRDGYLSFLVQAGLVGGVLFYCSLAHNLYRSVDDPFTRPSSRLHRYHLVNWTIVLLLAIPYTLPPSDDPDRPNLMAGFGYQAAYQMCWSPVRYGPHVLNNPQLLVFATLPIFLTVMFAPICHYAARRLLRLGGDDARDMLKPRERQVIKAARWAPSHRAPTLTLARPP